MKLHFNTSHRLLQEFSRRWSRFISMLSRAVCSPYSTLNLRRPSFSSRRRSDLEQSSAASHIRHFPSFVLAWRHTCSNCVIHNTFVVPAKWHRHFGHVNRFCLLTYLLTYGDIAEVFKRTKMQCSLMQETVLSGWYYLLSPEIGDAKHLPVYADSEKENAPGACVGRNRLFVLLLFFRRGKLYAPPTGLISFYWIRRSRISRLGVRVTLR